MLWYWSTLTIVIAFIACIVPICTNSQQTMNRTLISNDDSHGGVQGKVNKKKLIVGKQVYVAKELESLFYNTDGQPLNRTDDEYEKLVICNSKIIVSSTLVMDYKLCPTEITGSVDSYDSLLNVGMKARVYCCTTGCCTKDDYSRRSGGAAVPPDDGLKGWFIALLVVPILVFVAIIVGVSICCCCVCKSGMEMFNRSRRPAAGGVVLPNQMQYAHAARAPITTATVTNVQNPGYGQTGAAPGATYGAGYGQTGTAYSAGYGQTGTAYSAGYGQTGTAPGAAIGAHYGQTGAAPGAAYGGGYGHGAVPGAAPVYGAVPGAAPVYGAVPGASYGQAGAAPGASYGQAGAASNDTPPSYGNKP